MQGEIQIKSRGRLGNQMFIYAFVRRIAYERDLKGFIVIPEEDNRLTCFRLCDKIDFVQTLKPSIKQKIGIFVYSLLTRGNKPINKISALERSCQRILSWFDLHMSQESCIEPIDGLRNILALGYFQSEKCFASILNIIKIDFEFNQDIKARCKELVNEISKNKSCCIHIRRGDYMKSKIFGVCTDEYYRKSIELMKKYIPDVIFYVFSDDINSVKQEFASNLGDNTIYISSNFSDQESLYLGTMCENFIISNSTFSWWMQFLSDNTEKIVIAPSRWYNDGRECYIYQHNWILVEP